MDRPPSQSASLCQLWCVGCGRWSRRPSSEGRTGELKGLQRRESGIVGRKMKDRRALDAKVAGRIKLGTGISTGVCALKVRAHSLKVRAVRALTRSC